MSGRTIAMTDALYAHYREATVREHPALARLREETATMGGVATMQISPEQGQLLQLLVRLTGARRLLEVGTFTGYSALACALALPADGRILCCDINGDWTSVARRHWAEAGVAAKIELRLAPALLTMDALVGAGGRALFDMAFIDADKTNYDAYYERALMLVRTGGLICLDNMLWSGRIADPDDRSPNTAALRALNTKIADDPRVASCLLPIGDGLTLAVKL